MRKIKILLDDPILPGSVTSFKNKCGKPNCACIDNPIKLHGPYYRWTGTINGKSTSRIITKEAAEQCQKRINNYKRLKKEIKKLLEAGIENAPWNDEKADR